MLQRAAAGQNSESSSWCLHLRNREGENGCDALAKYDKIITLQYPQKRKQTQKTKKKWTTETEQRHFRISNHVLFRNDRGPQSSWENMKTQHTGLFYWEVKVLVTTPPSKKYINIYKYFLNTLQICCWSLCLIQILFSNAFRKLCYPRLLLRPILIISFTLNQHTIAKFFFKSYTLVYQGRAGFK